MGFDTIQAKLVKKMVLPMLNDVDYEELEKNICKDLKEGKIKDLDESSKIVMYAEGERVVVEYGGQRKNLKSLINLIISSI